MNEETKSNADGTEPVTSPAVDETEPVAESPTTDPQMEAVMFLHQTMPVFRNLLDKVTGTQAKNVLMALTEAPLNDNPPKFTTPESLKLYNTGLQIVNAKFSLFQNVIKGKTSEEILKMAEESEQQRQEKENTNG
jgi:hypothetical protein